jgi:hypothetical protein
MHAAACFVVCVHQGIKHHVPAVVICDDALFSSVRKSTVPALMRSCLTIYAFVMQQLQLEEAHLLVSRHPMVVFVLLSAFVQYLAQPERLEITMFFLL